MKHARMISQKWMNVRRYGFRAAVLAALWRDMKHKDWFMALLDVEDYIAAKDRALAAYEDRRGWAKKMVVNIAKSGYFSSDRTIAQYEEEIWKLK